MSDSDSLLKMLKLMQEQVKEAQRANMRKRLNPEKVAGLAVDADPMAEELAEGELEAEGSELDADDLMAEDESMGEGEAKKPTSEELALLKKHLKF